MEQITKKDLQELKTELKTEIVQVQSGVNELKSQMNKNVEVIVEAVDTIMDKRLTSLRKEIKHDMTDLRSDLYVEIKNKITEHVATRHI